MKNRLFNNTIILTIGTFLPKLTSLITLPILTAVLTKMEYGIYDLILSAASLAGPIMTMQIEQAVFRYLMEGDYTEKKEVLSTSLVYVCTISLVCILISLIIVPLHKFSILFGVYITMELLYKYILQVLRGYKLIKNYSYITMMNSIVGLVGIVFFVKVCNWHLVGVILSLIVGYGSAILSGCTKIRIWHYVGKEYINKSILKSLLSYSIPLVPNVVSWWLVGVSDRWIISWKLGLEENAVYSVANKIPNLFNTAYTCFNLAWQESAIDNREQSNCYYQIVFDYLVRFLLGALVVMIAVSPILFGFLVDKSYTKSLNQMSILFIAMFFHCLASFTGGIYVALKKSNSVGISAMVGAMLNVIINLSCISIVGLYAASISTLISYFAIFMYRYIDLRGQVKLKVPIKIVGFYGVLVTISIILSKSNILMINIFNTIIMGGAALLLNKKFCLLMYKLLLQNIGKDK